MPIQAYIDLIHDYVEHKNIHVTSSLIPTAPT